MHKKDKFDEMLIDIGNRMFDLQVMLAGFIREIMHEFGTESMEIDYKFPFRDGDDYRIYHGKRIQLDPDDMKLTILTDDPGYKIMWHEIDVLMQEIIANDLHMRYVSEIIHENLS